ncbi:MAG: Crp/Fnr family transcriptional regulator [Bacteroidetes bacterium]|nr:MAG: Crp/Fnr family transcriptional regulator [Bacteroidota bacterium]
MGNLRRIPNCSECILTSGSIFNNLSDDELSLLSLEKNCNLYKRGDIVYHEGNRMPGLFCISKGILKLYKTGIEGKGQIVAFAKQGDIIGYRSVLSNEVACTTAQVIEEAILCFIPADVFINLVKSNSKFSIKIMQLACNELGNANKLITDIAQKSVRERLAEILLILKDIFGVDENNVLQISLTREEIANLVGTATESVIRLLSEFKSEKMIELNGRKIRILDEKKIIKIGNVY